MANEPTTVEEVIARLPTPSFLGPYFRAKIGQRLSKTVTTGQTGMGQVYARTFSAEVLWVEDNMVAVYARSMDKTPSGAPAGGTEQDIGDHVVDIEGIERLDEFWTVLLTWIDALQQTQFTRYQLAAVCA